MDLKIIFVMKLTKERIIINIIQIILLKKSLDRYINMAKDIERKSKDNLEYCSYCKRSGHNDKDCWSKDKKMKKRIEEKEPKRDYEKQNY